MIINVLEQCLGYGKHSITVRCFFKINVVFFFGSCSLETIPPCVSFFCRSRTAGNECVKC